jgi:hypothetical protein
VSGRKLSWAGRLVRSVLLCACLGGSFIGLAQAQSPAPNPGASPVVKPAPIRPAAAAPQRAKPAWEELTPAQQQALKPLAGHWAGINETQKRKWLEVSRSYPTMAPPEQAKLHSHMTDWVNLTPQQRAQARLNYGKAAPLSADEKKAKWQAYQSLSPADKQKLAAKSSRQLGAAPAVKPIPPRKLATVPPQGGPTGPGKKPDNPSHQPKISVKPVDGNTLLPRP